MKLYLDYDERTWGGEALSDEDWPDYSDEHTEWTPKSIGLKQKSSYNTEVINTPFEVKEGDWVHLVWVRYETGSTFGRSLGRWYIIGVYQTADEANDIKESIDSDSYKGYKPWVGYFERFESCETQEFRVR